MPWARLVLPLLEQGPFGEVGVFLFRVLANRAGVGSMST